MSVDHEALHQIRLAQTSRCEHCGCALNASQRERAKARAPRCATCRFWAGSERCTNALAAVWAAGPDFGCVLHEVAA